jgi:hypothetical protein
MLTSESVRPDSQAPSDLRRWRCRPTVRRSSRPAPTTGAPRRSAAYGDPNEAITGTVATTGGVPIRVVLNRLPPIGTLLNLLDDTQSVVGAIRVVDHDSTGTTATVVTSYARTAPTSSWSVAAPQRRGPWLPS